MPASDESERYRRIREEQLRARDPQKQQHQLQRRISTKRKRNAARFSVGQMVADIPYRWKWLFAGLVIGLGLLIILPYFLTPKLANLVGGIAAGGFSLLGFALGRALDAKVSIKEWLGD